MIFTRCESRKCHGWNAKRRKVVLPTGDVALSQKKICQNARNHTKSHNFTKMNKAEEFVKKNPNSLVIEKCEDGNYKGYAIKFDKPIVVRDIGPETVVSKLITNDGKGV